jgi:hypothetical protein
MPAARSGFAVIVDRGILPWKTPQTNASPAWVCLLD